MVDRFKFPKGFKRHHAGQPCPVDPTSYVEAIVRTAEGYGSSGIVPARTIQWDEQPDEGGLGETVGFRSVERQEAPRFKPEERF